jgi:hypothetical protein
MGAAITVPTWDLALERDQVALGSLGNMFLK